MTTSRNGRIRSLRFGITTIRNGSISSVRFGITTNRNGRINFDKLIAFSTVVAVMTW